MFSKLYNTLEKRQEWLDVAKLGADFIFRHGKANNGRVYFSLTRDGKAASIQRKPFSECFYVMAMAEYWRATGQQWAKDEALKMFAMVEQLIADPEKLGRPILEGTAKMRSLAVPMIMLGLCQEMEGLFDAEKNADECKKYAAMMLEHYDRNRRVLSEFISTSREDISHLPEGRLINPGHSIEGGWFLLEYARKAGHDEYISKACDIIEGSLEMGWDEKYGGLFYFLDTAGLPPAQIEWSMKLWWPHTEALYALVAAWSVCGENKFNQWHDKVLEYSLRVFSDAQYGEWFGYCDRYGEATHTLKGGAYKGCFHVPRALLLCLNRLKECSGRG
jgi:N-acylglucosamine 2-epimerase